MPLILVVDDEEYIQTFVREVMEREGYVVITTGSPQEALQLCQERSFDLVIMDLVIRDMNGLELIRSLRQSHPNLPVLAISGASKDLLEMAIALGAVGTLEKPFIPDNLLAVAAKILGDQRHGPMNEPSSLLCPRCKAVIYYDPRGDIEAKNICPKCKTIIPELEGKLIVAFERPRKGG